MNVDYANGAEICPERFKLHYVKIMKKKNLDSFKDHTKVALEEKIIKLLY